MNRLIRFTVLLVFCVVATSAGAAEPPSLARLVVVDNSPSMSGERIETVRRELAQIVSQLPPSPEHPLVLIKFGAVAESGIICTDVMAAERAIKTLKADSNGTSVAAGLRQSHTELQQWRDADDVLVLLYTDFNDSDRQGIQAAETQLDQWFGARSKDGKTQSVFVKRWGNNTSALLSVLSNSKNVNVVEINQLEIKPVTIHPEILVESVRRRGAELEVDLVLANQVKAAQGTALSGHVGFHCILSGIEPSDPIAVPIGSAKKVTLTTPLPRGKHGGTIVLPFLVSTSKQPSPSGQSVILPSLSTSRVEVEVTVPVTKAQYVVTTTVEMNQPPRWKDPLALVAEYPLTLVFDVPPANHQLSHASSTFEIVALDGCRIESGKARMTMSGTGTYRLPLTVAAAPTNRGVPVADLRFRVALQIKPVQVPPDVEWQPRVVLVEKDDLAAPDSEVAVVEANLIRVDRVAWLDLRSSVAIVDGVIAIDTLGKVPPATTLSFSTPSGIRQISAERHELRSGRQEMKIRVVGVLPPAPKKMAWSVHMTPVTKQQVGVELLAKGPLVLDIVGPPKAQIEITDGSRSLQSLDVVVADNDETASVDIVPSLRSVHEPSIASGELLRITSHDPQVVLHPPTAELFQACRLQIQLPERQSGSFFRDEQITTVLLFTPDSPLPTVEPAQTTLTVTRQAPFKRLLAYLSIALCSIGTVATVLRMLAKLKEPVA